MTEKTKKAPRAANFELLRIAAMGMVIVLHYLSRAQALVSPDAPLSAVRLLGTALEALSIAAVNVYVLLSGYFLVEAGFRLRRLLYLLCEILFYTVGIPLVLWAAGLPVQTLPLSGGGIWSLVPGVFPILTEHYWFATAYVLMLLFTPALNIGLRALSRRQLQGMLGGLLFFFCLVKSVSPVPFVTDHSGYDFGWFLCLYTIAAYVRRFGVPWAEHTANGAKWTGTGTESGRKKAGSGAAAVCSAAADGTACGGGQGNGNAGARRKTRRRALALYLVSAAGIFLWPLVFWILQRRVGADLSYAAGISFHYNFVLALTAALGLFALFQSVRIPEGRAARFIRRLAPCTFGVYLIHENIELRDRWFPFVTALTNPSGGAARNPALFLLQLAVCVVLVYAVCAAIDAARQAIFWAAGRALARTRLGRALRRLDDETAA